MVSSLLFPGIGTASTILMQAVFGGITSSVLCNTQSKNSDNNHATSGVLETIELLGTAALFYKYLSFGNFYENALSIKKAIMIINGMVLVDNIVKPKILSGFENNCQDINYLDEALPVSKLLNFVHTIKYVPTSDNKLIEDYKILMNSFIAKYLETDGKIIKLIEDSKNCEYSTKKIILFFGKLHYLVTNLDNIDWELEACKLIKFLKKGESKICELNIHNECQKLLNSTNEWGIKYQNKWTDEVGEIIDENLYDCLTGINTNEIIRDEL